MVPGKKRLLKSAYYLYLLLDNYNSKGFNRTGLAQEWLGKHSSL